MECNALKNIEMPMHKRTKCLNIIMMFAISNGIIDEKDICSSSLSQEEIIIYFEMNIKTALFFF